MLPFVHDTINYVTTVNLHRFKNNRNKAIFVLHNQLSRIKQEGSTLSELVLHGENAQAN